MKRLTSGMIILLCLFTSSAIAEDFGEPYTITNNKTNLKATYYPATLRINNNGTLASQVVIFERVGKSNKSVTRIIFSKSDCLNGQGSFELVERDTSKTIMGKWNNNKDPANTFSILAVTVCLKAWKINIIR